MLILQMLSDSLHSAKKIIIWPLHVSFFDVHVHVYCFYRWNSEGQGNTLVVAI